MSSLLLSFAAWLAAAVALYPGGSWSEPTAPGFSFWQSYWCDLLEPRAPSGADNSASAWCARLAFASFALALWCFWPLAARRSTKGARLSLRLGRVGALGLLAVALVPPVRWPVAHGALVSVSALSGIVAAVVLMPALSPRSDRVTLLLGAGLALSSSITLLQYLRQGISGANYADWLAGSQKFATGFLLAWMLRVLHAARRERARDAN